MNERRRTYTIEELETLSGFDRRTIAYYVQEGLLPKIGRRGPRTRYPQLFLDRLLFIRKIRDLEETGEIPGQLTLAQIREHVFDTIDEATIARVAAGEEDIHAVAMSSPAAEMHRDPGVDELVDTARFKKPAASMAPSSARARRMWMAQLAEPSAPAEHDDLPDAVGHVESERLQLDVNSRQLIADEHEPLPHRLGELLSRLTRRTGSLGRRWGRRSEHWTRANITRDITISARNLDEDAADLLEEVARILRRMMRGRD